MVQDSTLNNLVDPTGYKTGKLGELAEVRKVGNGRQAMILIPGLGFGANVFDEFMQMFSAEMTMYSVTLPGFGGTAAPPTPAESTSFGEQTWTNAAYQALNRLIDSEKMQRPIVVGHWLTGTQLALRMALEHPDKIRGVVLLSGSPCFVPVDTSKYKPHPPLDFRITGVDKYIAPQWFKSVTRATWDDNNFLPSDYAANPVRGLRLWRWAAEPPLHVWIRYLCEFYAQDITLDLARLSVPVLLLKPGLEGAYFDPGQDYLTAYCHTGWNAAIATSSKLSVKTIPESRVCMWYDQLESVATEIRMFVQKLK